MSFEKIKLNINYDDLSKKMENKQFISYIFSKLYSTSEDLKDISLNLEDYFNIYGDELISKLISIFKEQVQLLDVPLASTDVSEIWKIDFVTEYAKGIQDRDRRMLGGKYSSIGLKGSSISFNVGDKTQFIGATLSEFLYNMLLPDSFSFYSAGGLDVLYKDIYIIYPSDFVKVADYRSCELFDNPFFWEDSSGKIASQYKKLFEKMKTNNDGRFFGFLDLPYFLRFDNGVGLSPTSKEAQAILINIFIEKFMGIVPDILKVLKGMFPSWEVDWSNILIADLRKGDSNFIFKKNVLDYNDFK